MNTTDKMQAALAYTIAVIRGGYDDADIERVEALAAAALSELEGFDYDSYPVCPTLEDYPALRDTRWAGIKIGGRHAD